MGWIDSTISTVGNLVQGYENRRWQEQMQQKAYDWQEKMQGKAYDWQEYMYEKQKHDNSWSAQLKQLEDAGISPAMIANGASFQPAQGQSAPSMPNAPSMPMSSIPFIGDSISQIYDNMMKKRQIERMDIENEYLPKINDKMLEKADAEIQKMLEEKTLTQEQANQIRELLPLMKDKTQADIDEIKAMKDKLVQETNNLSKEEKYLKWKTDFMEKYGFNPESEAGNALLQALVSGKGDAILDSIINTLKGIINESDTVENIEEGLNNLEEKEKNLYIEKTKRKKERQKKRDQRQKERLERRNKRFVINEGTENSTYFNHGK